MSEHDWKPGDMAMAECLGMRVVGIVDTDLRFYTTDPRVVGVSSSAFCLDSLRPLLVIDPEDREQVRSLLETYGRQFTDWTPELDSNVTRLQQALRAMLAPPTPPKPEEPLGLGAVVEYDGSRWVGLGRNRWLEVPADERIAARSLHWDDFYADVEILSQGVS